MNDREDDPKSPAGQPESKNIGAELTGATRVEPIDLSTMVFSSIECSGRCLMIDPPLSLDPTMDDESGQLYVLADDSLGLHVFAQTREQVRDELADQLLFQWDYYASELPERLTSGARRLREAMKLRIREVDVASQSQGY